MAQQDKKMDWRKLEPDDLKGELHRVEQKIEEHEAKVKAARKARHSREFVADIKESRGLSACREGEGPAH